MLPCEVAKREDIMSVTAEIGVGEAKRAAEEVRVWQMGELRCEERRGNFRCLYPSASRTLEYDFRKAFMLSASICD
jgi:hypothetical protein